MGKLRVLTTGGLLAAVGVAAVLVVGMAGARPRSIDHDALAPLPGSPVPASQSKQLPSSRGTAPRDSAKPDRSTGRRIASALTPTPDPASTATPKPATSPTARRPVSSSTSPAPAPISTTTAVAPKTPPALVRGQPLPLGYPTATATRVVTVVASSTSSTTASVQAWDRAPGGGWLRHGPAIGARVGSEGLTTAPSESRSATPIGSFTLTQAFGRATNPGTGLPYFVAGVSDWWVSDTSSSLYNTHQRCTSCPFDTAASENLYGAGPVYGYAVVIDYNRFPVQNGAGSAFFLHVTDGSATAGCVSIPRDNLVAIMQWLTPSAQPRILIGVA
ncbi:MAG: L,D-transpeptidase family protein [Actinomycetota bacterium]